MKMMLVGSAYVFVFSFCQPMELRKVACWRAKYMQEGLDYDVLQNAFCVSVLPTIDGPVFSEHFPLHVTKSAVRQNWAPGQANTVVGNNVEGRAQIQVK